MIFGKRKPDDGPIWSFAWRPYFLEDGENSGWIWLEYGWKTRVNPHHSEPNATIMFRDRDEATRYHVGWDC